MERNHKITIPEPCHEKWDEMTPKDNGRFCMSCSKTVVDFSIMSSDEIKQYFIKNQNKKICGRFKTEQLDSIIIQVPSQILYAQTNYYKMFLLALFIAMGTTLFSCQDKNGNKQKIDKVEVVEEPEHITVGVALPPKHDPNAAVLPPPPPPKTDHVKFVKPVVVSNKHTKVVKSKKINCERTNPKIESDSVQYDGPYLTGVVYMGNNTPDPADYPGGQNKFFTVFKRNFIIPENASKLEGELELAFDINELGKPDNIKVLKDLDKGISEEGIRVLRTLAKWKPTTVNGKGVSTPFTVKIIFSRDTDLNGVKTRESKSQIVSIKLNPELQ